MEGRSSFARYVWFFTAINVVVIILIGAITAIFAIDPGSGPAIAAFFVSTAAPAQAFVKDHHRLPTQAERKRLVRWCFVAYLGLTAVLLALLLILLMVQPGPLLPEQALPETAGMGSIILILLISLAFGLLLAYGLLVLGIKVFSKQAMKALEKQGVIERQETETTESPEKS